MYKRLELHNHTNESDASCTCRELTEFMAADQVDAFALTDHNTISGHKKIQAILEESCLPVSFIPGMEYTTYYGHILCLNLREYVPWENINKHKPELLFQAARAKGALVGIAHPFSFGWPFAQGCQFVMHVTDYSCCDFIEIFNNPEPLSVNEKALSLWESLVLSGEKLSATCGMDLHDNNPFAGHYATYIQGEEAGDVCRELTDAIHTQKTWVCKGPLLETHIEDGMISFSIYQTRKSGYLPARPDEYSITLKSGSATLTCRPDDRILVTEFEKDAIIIPKLYKKGTVLKNLMCVSPVIHL
ncbi:CehA/McbA family metallohydrolase [Novisyntrophococcus fermenticellae]|uniref:CehA/McbA family metallohydrolase n=1 Tax=Novisyntrophococcus fermenticellae TaxID=2068655 RepID=UPI001E63F8DB|nr:CehA/McbA family metallohydrolase [Novisyntrophococcus fermenticellae]